ncbi:MAG: penicillin acylase family protein, partial [Alphaproteobacteria bacterium]
LLLERIRRLSPADPAAKRAHDALAGWDGRIDAAATAPTLYAATRRALTRLLLDRSGLAKAAGDPLLAGPPPVAPMMQAWWMLPTLLRTDDPSLLGGLTWDAAIEQALAIAAAEPARTWADAHRPRFVHPLSARFPEAAGMLDPTARPVGGDNDCVLATGLLAGVGLAAAYGPVARYVFDVGDWEASRWIVFHGTSGLPGHPHWEDQHALWASGSLVPMHYAEDRVEAAAIHSQVLAPA